jgi:four helix bundle protein
MAGHRRRRVGHHVAAPPRPFAGAFLISKLTAFSNWLSAVQVNKERRLKDFRNLTVWAKAHQLTLAVYQSTATFPRSEFYGLTSQIRRASVSIPANIAEGCGRSGDAEFARFLQIGMGSASELEYHPLLAHELGFLDGQTYGQLAADVIQVKRMLSSLIAELRASR